MNLSIIILTKNEEKMIKACLESIKWADEIIVVDDQSTDRTREIARKYTDKVFVNKMKDFSSQREFALQQTQSNWILYVDADERVTPELQEEIKNIINNETMKSRLKVDLDYIEDSRRSRRDPRRKASGQLNHGVVAYYVPRKNIFLGREQKPDKVERLFKRKNLIGWFGKIHESPKVEGAKAILKNYLIHLTHRDITSMTKKTLAWSQVEAELKYQAGHPPVTWWRLLKVMKTEFCRQVFVNRIYRYGLEGWIEGIFQVFSAFMTHVRLWERQRGESLEATYEKIDQELLGKMS